MIVDKNYILPFGSVSRLASTAPGRGVGLFSVVSSFTTSRLPYSPRRASQNFWSCQVSGPKNRGMRAKRFAQVSASNSEDGDASPSTEQPMDCEKNGRKRKRNDKKLPEEKEEEEEEEEEEEAEAEEEEEGELDDPKPEDSVYITPETTDRQPDIAIIKDITHSPEGRMIVTFQRFYRPEEVEKKDGGSWPTSDTCELFYSWHREELPAEAVMHKCVVHFVPIGRQLPDWRKHPGYVVQHVYEVGAQQLWKILDKDHKQEFLA